MKKKTMQKIKELKEQINSKVQMSTSGSDSFYIYGDIVPDDLVWWYGGVSSEMIKNFIEERKDSEELTVHINSCGGDVFEGVTIYNLLKNASQKIKIVVDGCACSAASVIAMAGDTVVMNPGTLLMIHNAWTTASGNAEELRKVADDLDTIMESNRQIYLNKANIEEEKLIELLNDETWLTPEQAKEYGFCDIVSDEVIEPQEPETLEQKVSAILEKIIAEKSVVIEPTKTEPQESKGFFGFGK